MSIRKIPSNTSSFVFYNANPKNGRSADCVARAICVAVNKSWEQVIREMTELGISHGKVFNEDWTIDNYLKQNGFIKHKQPRKDDNTKYTGREWCKHLSINDKDGRLGTIVANIGGHHTVCIKPTNSEDGFNCRYKILDTWDSSNGCIGNYWIKK